MNMLRCYLDACLELHSVVSFVVTIGEGHPELRVYQALATHSRIVTVRTYTSAEEQSDKGLYSASVQPLCRWNLFGEGAAMTAEVFAYQEPSLVDLLSIAGVTFESLASWMSWFSQESGVYGCISMFDPKAHAAEDGAEA